MTISTSVWGAHLKNKEGWDFATGSLIGVFSCSRFHKIRAEVMSLAAYSPMAGAQLATLDQSYQVDETNPDIENAGQENQTSGRDIEHSGQENGAPGRDEGAENENLTMLVDEAGDSVVSLNLSRIHTVFCTIAHIIVQFSAPLHILKCSLLHYFTLDSAEKN